MMFYIPPTFGIIKMKGNPQLKNQEIRGILGPKS